MSRFGRNYLQVGQYTEVLFPDKGVRFIAINNNVDSNNAEENDFTPFLNIMNEWYAKDTSRKIKSVFRSKMAGGERCTGSVPYGYLVEKTEEGRTVVIDEEAARVVRLIFEMTAQGKSTQEIAHFLEANKVLTPAAYDQQTTGRQNYRGFIAQPYAWRTQSVRHILDRSDYMGTLALGKSVRPNFHSKKRVAVDKEKWMIFPDAVPPIVDMETWERAQKMRKRNYRPRAPAGTYATRLNGLIYCADCRKRMYHHKRPADVGKESESTWSCSTHLYQRNACTNHYVSTKVLEDAVREALQKVSAQILTDSEEFTRQLLEKGDSEAIETKSAQQAELKRLDERIDELSRIIKALCEKNLNGLLSDFQFERMVKQYDEEQQACEDKRKALLKMIETPAVSRADIRRFAKVIERYRSFEEISDIMLMDLVDRIYVHESICKGSRYRRQRLDIHFSFIGDINVFGEQPDDETYLAEAAERSTADKKEKKRQSGQRRKAKEKEIRKAAKAGDPDAQEAYQKLLEHGRANNARQRERKRAAQMSDPNYIADPEERNRIRSEKIWETRRRNSGKPYSDEEIVRRADAGEEEFAEQAALIRQKWREQKQAWEEKHRQRMAEDPAYAEEVRRKKSGYQATRNEREKQKRKELVQRAEAGDAEAAKELERLRARDRERTRYYDQRKREQKKGEQANETDNADNDKAG